MKIKPIIMVALLVWVLLVAATVAQANTYWVSKSASGQHCTNSTSDPGAGGSSGSINEGLNCLVAAGGAPHTLNIHSGRYTETITHLNGTLPTGTSDTNRIFIRAVDGAGTVTMDGHAGGSGSVFVAGTGASYWEVDGINIDATYSAAGVTAGGGGHHRFLNMDIANVAMALCPPVQTCGPGHAISQANIGVGVGTDQGSDFNYFYNVTIHDSTSSQADQGGGNCCQGAHGYYITTAFNTIDHTHVYNMGQHGAQYFHYGDLTSSHDNSIINSKIHDNGTTGLTSYCLASNGNGGSMVNTICYNMNWGIGTGPNGIYDGNTFDNMSFGITDGGAVRSGVVARNNIFFNVGTPIDSVSGAGFVHDHNACNTAGSGCNVVGSLNFVNAAGRDYHLSAGSVAIDTGANLGAPYNTDYDGNARGFSGAWDIGAYEYTGGAPPPPPSQDLVVALAFDEASGTIATDSSGKGNDATLQAGATRVSVGKYGHAISLNGNPDSFAEITHNSTLNLSPSGMTLEAWVKPTSSATTFTTALSKSGSADHLYWLYSGTEGYFCGSTINPAGGFTAAGNQSVCGDANISTASWVHVAVTYDGSALRFYRDGTVINTTTTSQNIPTDTIGSFLIGSSFYGEYFNGLIDEVRVYNYARTQAQVQTDMTTPIIQGTPTPTVSLSLMIGPGSSFGIGANSSVGVGQ
jgi:hypothetical protein